MKKLLKHKYEISFSVLLLDIEDKKYAQTLSLFITATDSQTLSSGTIYAKIRNVVLLPWLSFRTKSWNIVNFDPLILETLYTYLKFVHLYPPLIDCYCNIIDNR